MQQGQNSKNLNNSCYIYRSACNFLCSAAPAALFFSHSLSPPSSNCPVRTDISIAQKTCEFRPVDISVSLTKCNKLIYQSVYSLLETMVGVPLPSAHCVRSHLPQGDGFLAVAVQFPTEAESCLPGSQPSPSSLRDATSPERGRSCATIGQKHKSSPFGGAAERSEAERVHPVRN